MIIKPFKSHCIITAHLDGQTYGLLSALPGFKKWKDRDLIFRPVGSNIGYLLKNFPDAEWVEGAQQHLEEFKATQSQAEENRNLKLAALPELAKDKYQYLRLPRVHQRRAFLLSRDAAWFALLMEQRTGKTKVIIDTASYLRSKGKLHTLIIISVNGVHRNWIENEIPLDITVPWQGYYSSQPLKQFTSTLDFKKGLRIFAFHIDGFSRHGRVTNMFNEVIADGDGVMVVVDESTRIKNFQATRTKTIIEAAENAEYRRILTGAPITLNPQDVWAQFKFLDQSILGYDTLTTFRNHFCVIKQANFGGVKFNQILPGCRNAEELSRLIEGYSYRVLRKDCMDLPDKVYQRWPVEMTTRQRQLYETLRDEFIAELDGMTISAALAITRLIRLQQILSGWFPMNEPRLNEDGSWTRVLPIDKTGNARLAALDNILEDTQDKVIIWSRFRPDLDLIQRHLGPRAVSYHGGIKNDQRAENYRSFQHDDNVRWMVANQASAGLGLNLSQAGVHVYYANSNNLEHRLQSEDRAEAEGKRNATLVIDLETVHTVDSKIILNLKRKKNIADLITRDPKAFFMESE